MEEQTNLMVENRGPVTVVSFLQFSVLDRAQIDKIGAELVALVEEKDRKKILISFEGVDYLSSTVLGKLVALHKRIALKKGLLKLCGIKPSIREVFEITRLDKVFDIYADEKEAMESFGLFRPDRSDPAGQS
ncbi:MAG TPA: STAS domain-containing protein [Planctomycetota bacterium]|nr:STAS domain-containing protein [Planctomycetota bacterium]